MRERVKEDALAGLDYLHELAATTCEDETDGEMVDEAASVVSAALKDNARLWEALVSIADPTVQKVPNNPTKSDLKRAVRRLRIAARAALEADDA